MLVSQRATESQLAERADLRVPRATRLSVVPQASVDSISIAPQVKESIAEFQGNVEVEYGGNSGGKLESVESEKLEGECARLLCSCERCKRSKTKREEAGKKARNANGNAKTNTGRANAKAKETKVSVSVMEDGSLGGKKPKWWNCEECKSRNHPIRDVCFKNTCGARRLRDETSELSKVGATRSSRNPQSLQYPQRETFGGSEKEQATGPVSAAARCGENGLTVPPLGRFPVGAPEKASKAGPTVGGKTGNTSAANELLSALVKFPNPGENGKGGGSKAVNNLLCALSKFPADQILSALVSVAKEQNEKDAGGSRGAQKEVKCGAQKERSATSEGLSAGQCVLLNSMSSVSLSGYRRVLSGSGTRVSGSENSTKSSVNDMEEDSQSKRKVPAWRPQTLRWAQAQAFANSSLKERDGRPHFDARNRLRSCSNQNQNQRHMDAYVSKAQHGEQPGAETLGAFEAWLAEKYAGCGFNSRQTNSSTTGGNSFSESLPRSSEGSWGDSDSTWKQAQILRELLQYMD